MMEELRRELAAVARSVYWSETEGRLAVTAWIESGESAKEFCEKYGLSARRLEWWKRRLGDENDDGQIRRGDANGELYGGHERWRGPDERRVAGSCARGRIAELEERIADAHDVAGPELAGLDAGSVQEGAVPAVVVADLDGDTDARDRRMVARQLWMSSATSPSAPATRPKHSLKTRSKRRETSVRTGV